MSDTVSPQALALQIKTASFGDADVALAVLEDPDVAEVYSASTSTFPAKHWLETYRVSFGQMAKKSKVYGADAVLQELEKLPPNDAVSLFAYDANGQLGLFWLTEDNRLVGFAIVVPKK
ncbi:MAG TPA: hypothetical protein VMU22_03195 [Rhizomicrobium sp.]|nr:hypothetical protein [Rhizomicrobium sp.]